MAKDGASKYRMISRIGLNHPQANNYISFLLQHGHIEPWLDGDGKRKYLLTNKGKKLDFLLTIVQNELAGLFPPPDSISRLQSSHH